MTVEAILARAIKLHPLDLVARMDYLHRLWDRCDADNMESVRRAIEMTRNGVTT